MATPYTGPLRFEDVEIDGRSTRLDVLRPVEVDVFHTLAEITLAALEQGQTPEAFAARLEGPKDVVDELAAAYRRAYEKRYP